MATCKSQNVQGFHYYRCLWFADILKITLINSFIFLFHPKPKKFEVQIYFFELVLGEPHQKSACWEPWHLDYLAKGLQGAPRWSGSCHRLRPSRRSPSPEKIWFSSTEFEPRFSCLQPLTSNKTLILKKFFKKLQGNYLVKLKVVNEVSVVQNCKKLRLVEHCNH